MSGNDSEPASIARWGLFIAVINVVYVTWQYDLAKKQFAAQTKQQIDADAESRSQFTRQLSVQQMAMSAQREASEKALKQAQEHFLLGLESHQRQFETAIGTFKADQDLRRKPYLRFEQSGQLILARTATGYELARSSTPKGPGLEAPVLENLGEGPAMQVKLVWKIHGHTSVVSTGEIEEIAMPREYNLRAGERSSFEWVPELIRNDKSGEYKKLTGVIEMQFYRVTGEQDFDTMKFSITPVYTESPPRLVFDFNQWQCGTCSVEDILEPSNVAPPPLPPQPGGKPQWFHPVPQGGPRRKSR